MTIVIFQNIRKFYNKQPYLETKKLSKALKRLFSVFFAVFSRREPNCWGDHGKIKILQIEHQKYCEVL